MKENNILCRLFLTFMKIGLFTFGGGYAMISIIENICVEKNKWITHDEMMNVTVIAESTPGPIAINCATFVGYRQAGLAGATAATLGVTIPSFVIIYAISLFLNNFLEITVIAHAFNGIKIAVGVLIVKAAVKMMKNMERQLLPWAILACSFTVMMLINIFSWNFSSISLMLIAAVISLSFYILETKLLRKEGIQK